MNPAQTVGTKRISDVSLYVKENLLVLRSEGKEFFHPEVNGAHNPYTGNVPDHANLQIV